MGGMKSDLPIDFFGDNEDVIKLIVVITAQLNLLKPTGLYTLNGQILEYYIFVKLLFEKL